MADKVLPVDESKMQENSVISGKNIIGLARTVAGIVGKGAQHVAEDYKAQGVGAKMASNEARALKAANATTRASKNPDTLKGKVDTEVMRGLLKSMKPDNPNVIRGGGMKTLNKNK
jgi:predicted secreted hydrolase